MIERTLVLHLQQRESLQLAVLTLQIETQSCFITSY